MQKVPSKLVVFPDEGHWVLKRRTASVVQDLYRLDGFLGQKVKTTLAIIVILAVAAATALVAMSTHTVVSLVARSRSSDSHARRGADREPSRRAPLQRYAEQNGARYLLFDESAPAHRWLVAPA